MSLRDRQRSGPIDWTPGTPGSDKNVLWKKMNKIVTPLTVLCKQLICICIGIRKNRGYENE